MGRDGADYSNVATGGQVNITHPMHASQHEKGGSDEISVEALGGELADEQLSGWDKISGKPSTFTPSAHKVSHQNAGVDEINVAGLSGELVDEQLSGWAKVSGKPSTFTPATHTHKVWKTLVFCVPGTLTTGSKKAPSVVADADMDIDKVYVYVQTVPTGATIIVDVDINGMTIFTNQGKRPEIAISANADESDTPDVTSVSKNDVFDINIDQVGSTVAGAVLSVFVRCKQDTTT